MKMLIQVASVFAFLYRGLLQALRVVAARTQVASWSAKDRQKGASALEYIVLAAAIIAIVTLIASTDVGNQLKQAFVDLFTKAGAPAIEES